MLVRMTEGEQLSATEMDWETRRVERGALAVVACPSSMSLVLQMPRGNLETVYPRALVLAVVRRDIMASVTNVSSEVVMLIRRRKAYRTAFLTCRKHRLDLNILYDLDPKAFLANLDAFLDQVTEVDYLNLFVSSLR